MPTATSVITKTAYSNQFPIKGGVKLAPPSAPSGPPATTNGTLSTSAAPLRSLYNRASKAFLHRDMKVTHSLIESAFHLLKPPLFVHDTLLEHRRKWDILRITLETTIYADPPPMDSLPESLRQTLTESSQTLLTSIYARSAVLFTPSNAASQKIVANPGYLPPTVLITLLYSSLKIDCPDIGRMMAEEWISRRESPLMLNGPPSTNDDSEEGGYDKVLEVYCLHILPKLEQWDYAKEFLQFESELPEHRREFLKSRLNAQRAEVMASRKPQSSHSSPSSSLSPTPRSHSPAPSSSSSSSLSTTSAHTVVPSTPKGHYQLPSVVQKLTAASHSSSSSETSQGTAIPRGISSKLPNGNARSRTATRTANSSSTSTSSALSSTSRSDIRTTTTTTTHQTPTLYSLIKATLAPHLTTSKIATFVVLFVLFPLISWVLRIRHKRRKMKMIESATPFNSHGGLGHTNVDLVRKRLQVAGGSDSNIVTKLWRETYRAVADTVMMAGKGLV